MEERAAKIQGSENTLGEKVEQVKRTQLALERPRGGRATLPGVESEQADNAGKRFMARRGEAE